jgi:hypothetical protein
MTSFQFAIQYSQRQTEALHALNDPGVREVLYGGGRGGGKSAFGCIWSVRHAFQLAAEHGLQPTRYPLPVGFLGRKVGTDFNDTTLEVFKRVIPAELYEIRSQDKEILLAGHAMKLCYGGLDSEQDRHKALGAEYAFLFLDQAEEMTEADVADLRGALRLSINGKPVPSKTLLTANPCQGWLKRDFIISPAADRRFIQALPKDNPWLPPDYAQTLRRAYQHRPELLAAYMEGSWDSFTGANQLIRGAWIENARQIRLYRDKTFRLLSCDVARFGDDETVIYDLKNTDIVEVEIYGQRNTDHTANRLCTRSRAAGNCVVVVDACGVGGEVVGQLRAMGVPVIGLDSGGKPVDERQFTNVRAEMWWRVAQMFAESEIQLTYTDDVLSGQLQASEYDYAPGGKLRCRAKAEVKAKLGRSPDRADAYVMGVYALTMLRENRYAPGAIMYNPVQEPREIPYFCYEAERARQAAQRMRDQMPRAY